MSNFGWESTTDEVLAGKDLSGKTVFITGGNSGLGLETGRAMASKGAHIVLAGRDQAKLDEAAGTVRSEVENAQVETIICDLASLNSVRACGKEANERFDKIDLLINNAGVMACPQAKPPTGSSVSSVPTISGISFLPSIFCRWSRKERTSGS